jgi:hypothetical protein
VTVPLDVTSWVFEKGHRVRVDLAGTDWPNVWPPPEPVTLGIDRSASRITLPVVDGSNGLKGKPELATPAGVSSKSAATAGAEIDSFPTTWRSEHDIVGRISRVVVDHGSDSKLTNGARSLEHYWGETGVSLRDPGHAWAKGRARYELTWHETTVASEVHADLSSDKDSYHVDINLEVTENDQPKWTRTWKRSIPRHLQ